jgi:hypothetical protein
MVQDEIAQQSFSQGILVLESYYQKDLRASCPQVFLLLSLFRNA